jgi:hypothetical protein
MARQRIGELLVAQGRIDALQLDSALAHQRKFGCRLGRAIVELGFLPEATVLEAVGQQLGVPFVHIGDRTIPPQVLSLVPDRLMRARRAVPLARVSDSKRGAIVVALADPADLAALDEIAFATGLSVKAALASEVDIDRALARVLDGVLPSGQVGYASRKEALDLPEDTNPLRLVRSKTPLH